MGVKNFIEGKAFAPSNIALCKYWGKRSESLNLPVNSSLSISLGDKGAFTKISFINEISDLIIINGRKIEITEASYLRIKKFLDLFREEIPKPNKGFMVNTKFNIPIAAGLASSACSFAALVKALDQLFNWDLSLKELSIIARLGSGSACRSIYSGFVKWHKGEKKDGSDSYAEKIQVVWEDLCIGLLIIDQNIKYLSSREAMSRCVATSGLYAEWERLATRDLANIEKAIINQDLDLLGKSSEANALAMHAIMLSARPAIMYSNPDTIHNIQKIWRIRDELSLSLYFTQDAGPNLKLLFLRKDLFLVQKLFPDLEIIKPFEKLYF